ncbi:AAA family ATPase [Rhodocyclus tenuis]|uniref:MoxR-like ATPase n=1 Tax=Rhodocyclus tenuis TaxID=1066 RepID=A0A840G8K7_RHOTE|nr:AAA family ATPase [Rhodocyclus tenuis]MBB4247038.1 MoxR-like ATPase [Rhodocyclus tenuis]
MPTQAPAPLRKESPLAEILDATNRVILGKDGEIRMALACLLARGHLLIEDLPGVGKTTLAHTLAAVLGMRFSRIQFTSDMLPADIIGISIFERERSSFRFIPGPIFAHVVLADEINRATPKTQSALLEAMEEHQVTSEGETRPMPDPFFVIATQNPSHHIGAYPLPESQLDRFMMRIALGYPDHAAERALLEGGGRRESAASVSACLAPGMLAQLQSQAAAVHVAPALLDYVQALLAATRDEPRFVHGLSPRAALALLAAARAWAFIDGRAMVLPEDVQTVLPAIARHRLRLAQTGSGAGSDDIAELVQRTPLS